MLAHLAEGAWTNEVDAHCVPGECLDVLLRGQKAALKLAPLVDLANVASSAGLDDLFLQTFEGEVLAHRELGASLARVEKVPVVPFHNVLLKIYWDENLLVVIDDEAVGGIGMLAFLHLSLVVLLSLLKALVVLLFLHEELVR